MDIPNILSADNIDDALSIYKNLINQIPLSISAKSFTELASLLKRQKLKFGPYPDVSLFETVNRVMTDLIILSGVRKLLKDKSISGVNLPFTSYKVQYGSSNIRDYDIYAQSGNKILIGEAFNVSKSFFQTKKAKMLKKLRQSNVKYSYLIIMCNDDAFTEDYVSKLNTSKEFLIPVEVIL